ncbi:MAG: hypothetical protein JW781_10390 [Deltaproteobacteria bacterium]|nr:hypothetical protein [Candidatus Anaeroferrophillacea bacterium]
MIGHHPPRDDDVTDAPFAALFDRVTGLYDQGLFRPLLEREVSRTVRHGFPFALALLEAVARSLSGRHFDRPGFWQQLIYTDTAGRVLADGSTIIEKPHPDIALRSLISPVSRLSAALKVLRDS